jgi:hypothetical protein
MEDGMGLRFQRRMTDQEIHATSRRWQQLVAPPWQQPSRRFDGADAPGAIIQKFDDEAILRRAKELCAHNGAVWDASELDQAESWERNKIVVDDAGHRKYLALAREELFNESGDIYRIM